MEHPVSGIENLCKVDRAKAKIGRYMNFQMFFGIVMLLKMSMSKILAHKYASMVFQNYQNFTEMTSSMIYVVAFGVGLKCPHQMHWNTQCPPPIFSDHPAALQIAGQKRHYTNFPNVVMKLVRVYNCTTTTIIY